jgi:hypothetical protein
MQNKYLCSFPSRGFSARQSAAASEATSSCPTRRITRNERIEAARALLKVRVVLWVSLMQRGRGVLALATLPIAFNSTYSASVGTTRHETPTFLPFGI